MQGFVKLAISQMMDTQLVFAATEIAFIVVSSESLLAKLAPGFASHKCLAGLLLAGLLLAWILRLCLALHGLCLDYTNLSRKLMF